MKKFLSLAAVALVTLSAHAIPAVPHPIEATQPDGTKIIVKIVGDEFFNYQTTVDDYTIMRNTAGYYVYALKENGDLVPSKVIVHNEGARTIDETRFLQGISKRMISDVKAREGKLKRAPVDKATKAAGAKAAQYDYNNFKGLIVLVQYTDLTFSRSDVQEFYHRMANEPNYSGYTNEDGSPNYYGACTGSVRDYYYDNSQGRFNPTFDVVGPVTVNYSVDDHNQTSNSGAIWAAALQQINNQVDFSQYDTDGDGNIDMIYFIGAGSGANSDGSSTHLWPHKSDLYWQNLYLDGKRARIYACSTEYLYNMSYGIFDGIGTICHEFSHVLGLPDLYDTDYASSGGQSQHPGEWEIMAGGSYQNNSRTPVAYSLYDRYSIGFANAQTINAKGTYTLNQIGSTGEGYIINSPESNVKFYIENRQNTRWDAYAPGHGMLICRVDSTSSYAWESNNPNSDPSHNYYVLLRAGNGSSNAQASDAFPTGAAMISNFTTPNLKTFNGSPCQYNISNIQENNGVITFTVGDDTSLQSVVEDFEEMAVTSTTTLTDVQGVYTTWNFTNAKVMAPGSDHCNGEHAAAMRRPSALAMSRDVRYVSYMVKYNVNNGGSSDVKISFSYSTDQGSNWQQVANASGDNVATVAGGSTETLSYTLDMAQPVRYRINVTAGSTAYTTYIDDFTIYYTDVLPPEATTLATVLSDGVDGEEYVIADNLAVVDYAEYADYAFLTDGNGNWINVTASSDIFNQLIGMTTVKGGTLKATLSGINLNPLLTATAAPEAGDNDVEGQIVAYNLADTFDPKVNQVIDVTGYWSAGEGNMRGYQSNGQSMTLDTSWGATSNTMQNGKRYTVRCAMNIKEPWVSSTGIAPKSYDYDFQNYIGYALRMPSTPTAIEVVSIINDETVNVYNMQGQIVKLGVSTSTATQGLRPGIYLIGGKKVVVK